MQGFFRYKKRGNMEIIQECARNFKLLTETTTYTFHVSLNKKITVFDIDFEERDFHHAIGLQLFSKRFSVQKFYYSLRLYYKKLF